MVCVSFELDTLSLLTTHRVAATRSRTSIADSNRTSQLTHLQLPQARLVTSRWLVLATQELESQHGRHRLRDHRHHSLRVERQRREGVPNKDARARPILPKQIVCCCGETVDIDADCVIAGVNKSESTRRRQRVSRRAL